MKKHRLAPLGLLAILLPSSASAATLKVPVGEPLYSVDLPADWTSDEANDGILAHSPDKEATIFFEAATDKSAGELIQGAVDWLWEEDFRLDLSTQRETTVTSASMAWKKLSWSGRNEDGVEAEISFLYGDLGRRKLAVVTYWTTAQANAKDKTAIERMLDSFRRIAR
jgi:hypothetical protein